MYYKRFGLLAVFCLNSLLVHSQMNIKSAGQPAQLEIRPSGEHSIRVTLKPITFKQALPFSPSLSSNQALVKPVISIRKLDKPLKKQVGGMLVEIRQNPLKVIVTGLKNEPIQEVTFNTDGNIVFALRGQPVLGLGEGGSKPAADVDWRKLPVEFDRMGKLDKMQPRWQRDAYGSRNPVPMLIGTEGWGLFWATPWVEVNLSTKNQGVFVPWKPEAKDSIPQTTADQGHVRGKGLPPTKSQISGLYDVFIFDARKPSDLMKDLSVITGPAVMPPKWALGYMQSHRTLETDNQMIGIVDTFRQKKIPVDAVIYLGTGFTPRGWNKKQPSFEFNPEVFLREPKVVIDDFHDKHVKVVLHMVPWDRDKLPGLHGSIPAKSDEIVDGSHIESYWKQHVTLMKTGIDGFWPDEGDWFNLYERIKRHQLYYQGPLSTKPNVRPWSLHRNGYLGIAQWGGWVWSGDTESSWKTLETQIAVGINHSLSLSPYWGTDIGGFFATPEKTGELFARWYQFGTFNPSFRSHGRTPRTTLPWGWNMGSIGNPEMDTTDAINLAKNTPLNSETNNPAIEPVIKQYAELRYQLLPYTYTLAWEARTTGMPFMRSLWLHYPQDMIARSIGNEFLWGRDMLIAPVFEKGAKSRKVYLPHGEWYDWWTNVKAVGGQTIIKEVDLKIMPIYIRAGAIIPFDPVRQYTDEVVNAPTRLKIYSGADGQFTLYEDDGISQDYLVGKSENTVITWNDKSKKLVIAPETDKLSTNRKKRIFEIQLLPDNTVKTIEYETKKVSVSF